MGACCGKPLPEPPPLWCQESACQLVLTRRGSSTQIVLSDPGRLASGLPTRLTLASPSGWAVVPTASTPDGPYAVGGGHWSVMGLGVGSNQHCAVEAVMDVRGDGLIIRPHDGRVFDVSYWQLEDGNELNIIRDAYDPKKTAVAGEGRSFVINPDGTISPRSATHLVLGYAYPDVTLVKANDNQHRLVFEHRDELGGGTHGSELTLASHPGLAVMPKFIPRSIDFSGINVRYVHLGVGPPPPAEANATPMRLRNDPGLGYFFSQHPDSFEYVLDIPFDTREVGTGDVPMAVIFMNSGAANNREPGNTARMLRANADGTIGSVASPDLVLGIRPGKEIPPQG